MKIKQELLEYLVRSCVKEVLDQVEEEQKLKVKFGDEKKEDVPVWKKKDVKFDKDTKFKKKVKKLSEADDPNQETGASAPPAAGQGSADQPAEPKPEEPKTPEEPKPEETPEPPPKAIKGAALVNPKDKSKLQPIKFQGRDESSIERTLHQVAVSLAGSRTKVSLGAKRLAREVVANPNTTVYFYLGKTDPESEEIFLMADKSLQIAKDDSIEGIGGTPVSTLPANYKSFGGMNDDEYAAYMNTRNLPTPKYGIDEAAAALIRKAVHRILDNQ